MSEDYTDEVEQYEAEGEYYRDQGGDEELELVPLGWERWRCQYIGY